MGVDLRDIAPKHAITFDHLRGKVTAIDAFNILYQFLSSIRQEDGKLLVDLKGRITSHLSGLFYRTARFIESGIKPVFVFDGKPLKFKEETKRMRNERKKEAEKEMKRAIEEERFEDVKKYAQATARIDERMIEESKQLLTAMGVPFVDAPSEGEAQAAMMVREGIAYGVASQDYDALLFGSPILIRNLSITGRRKVPRTDRYVMIELEMIKLEEVLSSFSISKEQLIMIGLLMGTDFNKGIKGIGPKKALKIVKGLENIEQVKEYCKQNNMELEEHVEWVFNFFLHPPYKEVKKIEFGIPNEEDIKKILCDEHDFSEERIGRVVDEMKKNIEEKRAQSRLDQF